jgi:indole-3-glycerol phosphate synthase
MILDQIIEHKKQEIKAYHKLEMPNIKANFAFLKAIKNSRCSIIGELKSKSPSEGIIKTCYQPSEIANAYALGGAIALSILTDEKFFGGQFSDIEQVKKTCTLPILCKDFIIDTKQIYRARQAGADACLLIVRILSDRQLQRLHQEIECLGMDALVEIFDENDLQRALKINPKLIGINNRNLNTLEMDLNNAYRLKKLIPNDILVITLSGSKTPESTAIFAVDFDGVLMGTALMKSDNPTLFLKDVQKTYAKLSDIL